MINYKFKAISLLLTFLVLSSCSEEISKKKGDIIKIDLEKKETVGPFLRTLMPFTPFEIDSLNSNFKGIPMLDTVMTQQLILFSPKRLDALYASDSITKPQFDTFISSYFAVTGFEHGKQFFIIDLNRDNDFSNDRKVVFDKTLSEQARNDVLVRDSFKLVNIDYNYFLANKIVNIHQHVRFFPYKDYFTFKEPNEKLNLFSDLQLVSETNEHWVGNFEDEGENYEIAINSSSQFGDLLVIRENKTPFPETRNSHYFKHKIGDTLKLNNSYFRLDSLTLTKSNLFLEKLGELKGYYGYLKGDYVKNTKFKDIDGNLMSLKELVKSKDYLLIDFWGTWCIPCTKLTPDLVKLNNGDKNFNILSVAFEYNVTRGEVKEYLATNKMTWTSTYELKNSVNKQTSFVHNFKVTTFPTFILLDKDLTIVYRGFGIDALQEAVALINFPKRTKH